MMMCEPEDYRWLVASDGHVSGMNCSRCDYRIHVALLPDRTEAKRKAHARALILDHYTDAHPDRTKCSLDDFFPRMRV